MKRKPFPLRTALYIGYGMWTENTRFPILPEATGQSFSGRRQVGNQKYPGTRLVGFQKRLSLYSSLGNHTIAESVGLIFGGAVFRSVREGRAWVDKGLEVLKQEVLLVGLGMSMNQGDWPLPVPAVDSRHLADLQIPALVVHEPADAIEGLLRGEQWAYIQT